MNKRFRNRGAAGIIAAFFCCAGASSQTPLYHLVQTIPLGGGIKWDYLHFDPSSNRVFISQGTELTVLDAGTGAIIGRVTGLQGSHGIAIDPQTGQGFADSGKTRQIAIFDLKSLKTTGTIPALLDADGMVFDAPSNQVFTVGGDANAAQAVNATTHGAKATIPLGGSPEFLVTDAVGAVFVNINDKDEIVRIDTKTDKVTARWSLPGCNGPTGLAIDTATHVLFASCDNAVMSIVNAKTGAVLAILPIGKGTDSAAFDPARKLAFSANRDGTLSIIHEISPRQFEVLPAVKTESGARTIAIDSKTGRIFLVTGKVTMTLPPKTPVGPPHFIFAPGSLHVLIYAPAR